MPRYLPEPDRSEGMPYRTGILLLQLGTPDEATAPAVRRYLKEFLGDPRVVEIPKPLWWLILNGVILNIRPKKSAAKYATIWTPEGSPLRVHTEKQTKILRGFLGEHAKESFAVEYAMRYGNPGIAAALEALKAQYCDRILLVPLYPQYAASTTAAAFDAVFDHLKKTRNMPAVRSIRSFHNDPGYIAALAGNIHNYWLQNGRPDVLMMSFHGLPQYTVERGDPYYQECQATSRLLAQALQLSDSDYILTFQSRFGRTAWLQPYTAPTLKEYGKAKMRRVDVVCPGFVADCLETLEEIAIEGKQEFLNAGGREFHYIPCLNERDDWMHALANLVERNLQGWD